VRAGLRPPGPWPAAKASRRNASRRGKPEASEIVDAACEMKQPCIIRARVERRDTPNGMPQTFNILRIYSVKKDFSGRKDQLP
jgi:hypothetical protein